MTPSTSASSSRRLARRTLTLATVVLAFGTVADASTLVFSRLGDPDNNFGALVSEDGFQRADDFTLSTTGSVQINEVRWIGTDRTGPTAFLVRFFDHVSGNRPAVTPFADVAVSATSTSLGPGGGSQFTADLSSTPVSLDSGTPYWISILEDDPSTGSVNWKWFADIEGQTGDSRRGTDTNTWTTDSNEIGRNFQLFAASTVPEPSTALLFAGVAVAAVLRPARRR